MANRIILVKDGEETETEPEKLSQIIIQISGDNNLIKLEEPFNLTNSLIKINGSNNKITVAKNCRIINTIFNLNVSADNRTVTVGECCHIYDSMFSVCDDSDSIKIGKNCLIKSKCHVRTQDGHTIFDVETKQVLNRGGSVKIGDHVFVGNRSFIGKNCTVADDTVILPMSVVTAKFDKSYTMIGGVPARVLRENIVFSS